MKKIEWPLLIVALPIIILLYLGVFGSLNDEELALIQTCVICSSILLLARMGLQAWETRLAHQEKLNGQPISQEERKELLSWLDQALLRSLPKAAAPTPTDKEALQQRLRALINSVKDELANPERSQPAAEQCLQKLIDQMEQLLLQKPTA
jgi:hypothetical protein